MNKILIVEDDPKINKMVQILLRKNKYLSVPAFSGTEALLFDFTGLDAAGIKRGKDFNKD